MDEELILQEIDVLHTLTHAHSVALGVLFANSVQLRRALRKAIPTVKDFNIGTELTDREIENVERILKTLAGTEQDGH